MKNNYIPFMKFKVNEVGSINRLNVGIKKSITPFFDIPRRDQLTKEIFDTLVSSLGKKTEKYLADFPYFFVDTIDIPDNIYPSGMTPYATVCSEFGIFSFVPVVGIDRSSTHNEAVFSSKQNNLISSDLFAIRVRHEDFANYAIVRDDFEELVNRGLQLFKKCILIIDSGFCLTLDMDKIGSQAVKFIHSARSFHNFSRIIFTGSSIPASIGDVVSAKSEVELERSELHAYEAIVKVFGEQVELGDYTIVSPLYSDITLAPEILLNVTAPKIIYSFERMHLIFRGGALRTHPRGSAQYNDIATKIINRSFYRGKDYSFGDEFLWEKAHGNGKTVTPSSILKPTINAHITFMTTSFCL